MEEMTVHLWWLAAVPAILSTDIKTIVVRGDSFLSGLLGVGAESKLWLLHLLTVPSAAKVSFLSYCIKICFRIGKSATTPTSTSSSLIKHHLTALQPCCLIWLSYEFVEEVWEWLSGWETASNLGERAPKWNMNGRWWCEEVNTTAPVM